jgi:hypothetical protein
VPLARDLVFCHPPWIVYSRGITRREREEADVVERRASEHTIYQDPRTGRAIWRLTQSDQEDKHRYYDACPWNADQSLITFSSADPADLTTHSGDLWVTNNGRVYVLDTVTFELRQVAKGAYFNTHTGAGPLWHPLKNVVYYYTSPTDVSCVDLSTGAISQVRGGMRQIDHAGEMFVWNCNEKDFCIEGQSGRGIYTMNIDGTDPTLIASAERIYEETPNHAEFDIADMFVQNTKRQPGDEHILMVTRIPNRGLNNYWKHLYVISRDGSEVRWLTDYGHHHSWTPDGKSVLYADWADRVPMQGLPREVPRLYLIDFDGSNKRMVVDHPLGGHPLMDPSGTRIVTWDDEGVILVDVPKQTVEYLVYYQAPFLSNHEGTHAHAVWNHDGTQILYNSAETGHSQVYLLPMA